MDLDRHEHGAHDASTLAECEKIIERGLATFIEVGEALVRIRDERLYRESHKTFEAYCNERWRMSRKRAYDLLVAAETAHVLSPNGDMPTPRNEAVARVLVPLRRDPEQAREVWARAVEEHGPEPTAQQVRNVARFKGRMAATAALASVLETTGPVKEAVAPPEITRFVTRLDLHYDAADQSSAEAWAQRLIERASRSGAVCVHRTTRAV